MDIVAKLRDGAAQAGHYGAWSGGVLMEQAADEIEALRREQTQNTKISEAMREALEMTRGNIASLAAAGRCTTYEDWARGIDQALVYADFAGLKMTTTMCADDWKAIAEHATREVASLRQNARRYEWLRERMLAADFDYMESGTQVLVFEMPDGWSASADCDATIDGAMAVG